MSPPARAVAFERFTREGPLALLPFAGRYALVWSLPPEKAQALAAAPPAEFLRELNAAAGTRPGRAVGVEARAVQPLSLRVREARIGERSAYIGNAAQTLHPVAGQGLNLGLRDAWDLAQIMRDAEILEIGRRSSASRRAGGSMPAPRSAPPISSPEFFSASTPWRPRRAAQR